MLNFKEINTLYGMFTLSRFGLIGYIWTIWNHLNHGVHQTSEPRIIEKTYVLIEKLVQHGPKISKQWSKQTNRMCSKCSSVYRMHFTNGKNYAQVGVKKIYVWLKYHDKVNLLEITGHIRHFRYYQHRPTCGKVPYLLCSLFKLFA